MRRALTGLQQVHHPLNSRRFSVVALLCATFLVAACGSGKNNASPSDESSTTPATDQTQPSTSTTELPRPPLLVGGDWFEPAQISWHTCVNARVFQCGELDVPINPDDESSATMGLKLIRQQARRSDERIGSLLMNPGGPGASGVEFVQNISAAMPAEIRDRFDLVGFDPRGIGESDPLVCIDGPTRDAIVKADPTPDDETELNDEVVLVKKFVAGCVSSGSNVLPFLGTPYVARDLDYMRQALGDDKLSYLGFSYGTSIGLAYLDRFPDRVRAMVLDGVQDPALNAAESLRQQLIGFEGALNDFFADCVSHVFCPIHNNGNPQAIWDAVSARTESNPYSTGDAIGRTEGPGEFLLANVSALYSKASWPRLASALQDAYEHYDGAALLSLTDSYTLRNGDGSFTNILDAQTAVTCSDLAKPLDPDAWTKLANELKTLAPRVGNGVEYSGLLGCDLWPYQRNRANKAVVGAGSAPVLLVGATGDPATPYEAAVAVQLALDNSTLLTRDGYGHGSYVIDANACVNARVNDYLINLTVAPNGTVCKD